MAAKTTSSSSKERGSAKDFRYWERISPVAEYVYSEGANEVIVYDDREGDTEKVHVQFAKVSRRGRRVATFSFTAEDLEAGFDELLADLQEALRELAAS